MRPHAHANLIATLSIACLSAGVLLGCPDEPSTAEVVQDTSVDLDAAVADDVGLDALADVGPDGADASDATAELPPRRGYEDVPALHDELWAGAAFQSFRFPIGIPTVGFGPSSGPNTRFNELYPGTDAQHTDVGAKALVLRRAGKSVVMVRLDLIGLWDTNRDEVAAALRAVGRADLADGVILSATHTHASGGRLMDHPIIRIAVDTFVPGIYKRVLDAIVASILAADAKAVPAKFGWTTIQVDALHSDRRCENGPIQDDTMGLIKLTAADDNRVLAVVINYAMHGTILGNDQHTLSGDAPAAVEFGVEHRLPAGAEVLFIQSWAGDMAPAAPEGYRTQQGFDLRPDFIDLNEISAAAADIIMPAIDAMPAEDTTPELHVENIRFPMDPLEINDDGSFDEFPYGGIYCMSTDDNCPDEGGVPYEELGCFGFSKEDTITSAQMAAARIGDLGMVTLPGEPVTPLGIDLRDKALAATGLPQVLVLGYSQGYLGYLLHPDDYWMGGYEGSGSLMGPHGGDFLVEMGTAIAGRMINPDAPLPFEPVAYTWDASVTYTPIPIESALGTPAVLSQPVIVDGVVEASWNGGDPAADHPVVTLEKTDGNGGFEPVTRTNGSIVTNYGPEMEIYLSAEPSYAAQHFGPRTFSWTVKLPTLFTVPLEWGPLQGEYRLQIEGARPQAYAITSEPFTIP